MKFDVLRNGRTIQLDISNDGMSYKLTTGGETIEFQCARVSENVLSLMIGDRSYTAHVHGSPPAYSVHLQDLSYEYEVLEGGFGVGGEASRPGAAGPSRIVAPMPGKVVAVLRAPGDEVKEGDGVAVIEAMKMQNEMRAPRSGRVKEIRVKPGETIESGAVVAVIEAEG